MTRVFRRNSINLYKLKEKYYIIKSNMEKNILLTIEYDGSEFSGWQKQPDRPTVQGYLEKVLSDLLKREIALSGTSRTDAGVHARGQKASFRTDINIPTERLALVINNILCGHCLLYTSRCV